MKVRLQRRILRKGEETSVPEVKRNFERNGMGKLELSASQNNTIKQDPAMVNVVENEWMVICTQVPNLMETIAMPNLHINFPQ